MSKNANDVAGVRKMNSTAGRSIRSERGGDVGRNGDRTIHSVSQLGRKDNSALVPM